jgi:hypothetical protein
MNLFLLFSSCTDAVKALCDQHVVKMILETAQVLYCCHHVMGKEHMERSLEEFNVGKAEPLKAYRPTHRMHPISVWVRAHAYHYTWACQYGLIMCKEYTLRYGKVHKTEAHLHFLSKLGYPDVPVGYVPEAPKKTSKEWVYATAGIPDVFYYFPLCMPEEFYVQEHDGQYNAVSSYQNFYSNKGFEMRYRSSKKPAFIDKFKKLKKIE